MNHGVTDTPEQVLKFAPKEKAANKSSQLDDAGEAIVAQIRTAADLVKDDCDLAISSRPQAFNGTQSDRRPDTSNGVEVEHWRDRAARAEQWLRTIQQEIEEKLLTRRSFSGAEGVVAR